MFKNYFKTTIRNMTRNKSFSIINLLGLTIGITACLMIFVFIMNEFSMDNFHKNGKDIYRVMRGFKHDGKSTAVAYLSGQYGPALTNDFKGEIKRAVRVLQNDNLVTVGNQSFHEKRVLDVDTGFFQLFTFPLIKGNASKVLNNPGNVVLTESTSKKYFGSADNAMGKVIKLDKELLLTVAGIAKDVPSNSHLAFDMIVPIENYRDFGIMKTWINNGLYTYVELNPNTPAQHLEKQFPAFMQKYMGSDMKKYGFDFSLSLLPLKDIYFANDSFDGIKHGDKTVVYIFLSIAALILLIACINFMNLSTIRSVDRSKEVGLRKVLGAVRRGLIWQFIGESVFLATISCVLSIGLFLLVMPWYNYLLGYSIAVTWSSLPLWLFLVGVIIVVGFLSGSYPAFVLSAFSPVQALKGKLRLGKGGSTFRQVLVVVQFCISVFLIVGTIIIAKQMNYVKNKQLGYQKEQTVIVPIDNNDIFNNKNQFKDDLQRQSAIQSVSLMSGAPGGFFDSYSFDVEGHNERMMANTEFSDFEFVKTLGLKIIAGRDFSPQFPTDSIEAVLINKTAASQFGWTPEQALGKWLKSTVRDSSRRKVIGVVADFNFQSLKQNINPLIISPSIDRRVALIRIAPGEINKAISLVKAEYNTVAPGYPLEYKFLDQQFDEMYKKDLRQQTLLSVFAGLAIFIACLGLFGLASFTATKRFKEIGVRKVLGSSVKGIVLLLSKDLLKPVLIATCIAMPVGYWAMTKWLENFAYKTSVNWWVFVLAALITVSIALLTVVLKAVKAAIANPVESLRSE